LFECVVNVSEGRRPELLDELRRAAGTSVRDLHADEVHNRSVFTLIDEVDALRVAVRALASATLARLDLRHHEGVHPRFGVLDVVPFVALDPSEDDVARSLRDETASWLADTFGLPVFLYGELKNGATRTLPEVRRGAFSSLAPDRGPAIPHPELGATAVGARGVLVAWNLWLRDVTFDDASRIAASIRSPEVRALAFSMDGAVQVSCNLIDPLRVGPSQVYDAIARALGSGAIDHAELVGLAPRALLDAEESTRWGQLGLAGSTTIESRLGDSARLGSALDGSGAA
jgi:glutamate formiminotransferase / 5-formyltetrahydrofolate cyclo-ligase